MHAPINLSKKSLDKFRYLVVEGPIGAGKTSLARRLAARLSADLLLEQPQENPFLARFTLSADELALYQKIYDALRPRAPAPDLVVYLQAQPAVLVERVRRRAAGYERGISEEYLALLAESYARFFYHYDAAPLLIVNSENLNFVERDADFELLVTRLRGMKSRREFFNLG
jgi:deoxyadenosine/deoxycytidine kinase